MRTLRIRNWEKFQHYKDRNPPWIKLHADLFTSEPWMMAPSDQDRLVLIALMQAAARHDNVIPDNPAYLAKFARLENPLSLDWAKECGFLEDCEPEDKWSSPWPSRHVPDGLREEVLKRDGYACVYCSATDHLEIDHIIPVSAGGPSLRDNLQVLCRSCNRKKRTRTSNAARTVANATQPSTPRSPETETEAYRKEKETNIADKSAEFEKFWDQYPKKVARRAAERAYRAALERASAEVIEAGLQSYRRQMDGKDAQYIAHAATWLNADRWADEAGTSTGASLVVDLSAFNSPEELEGQRKAMEFYGIKQAV